MQVAVGLILNARGEILIAERPLHTYQGGVWEFPGGKVEVGETILAALERELFEEVHIKVMSATPWLEIPYQYQDRCINLNVWKVLEYVGEPIGKEGQQIRWVKLENISQFQFPAANDMIVEKLIRSNL